MSQSSSGADLVPGSARSEDRAETPSLRLRRSALLLSLTSLVTGLAGFLQRVPCQQHYFDGNFTFRRGCYTDIYPLYFDRGLADGKVPYLDKVHQPVEYPVLTGWFMQGVNNLVQWFGPPKSDGIHRGILFYELTIVALLLLGVATVLLTSYVGGRLNVRIGLMVAFAPALLLTSYINWDLLAVALLAVSMAFWSRDRTAWAGLFLGLAISAKFYPVVLLWPLLLLTLRTGRWRQFFVAVGSGAAGWLVVNVPVMILAWKAWTTFYTFSQSRPVDFGSLLYVPSRHGWTWVNDVSQLNHVCEGAFAVCAVAIGVLAMTAPVRPRLPQLFFLTIAAFLLTNKVWSPQYVLWLLPLAVLARPKLPAFVLWQVGEIVYYYGVWWLLLNYTTQGNSGIAESTYFWAQLARFVPVLLLAVLVVVEILRPKSDIVRIGGVDDPAGGPFDMTDDVFVLRPRARSVSLPEMT